MLRPYEVRSANAVKATGFEKKTVRKQPITLRSLHLFITVSTVLLLKSPLTSPISMNILYRTADHFLELQL